MKAKKALSLLLSLTLVLSMIVVPSAAAATAPEIKAKLVKIDMSEFAGTVSNSMVTEISSVQAGETIALQIVAENNTSQSYNLASYVVNLTYDKAVFDVVSGSYEDEDEGTVEYAGVVTQKAGENGFPAKWTITPNAKDGTAYWSAVANVTTAKTNTVELKASDKRILGYLLLQAKTDVESGNSSVAFVTTGDNTSYLAHIESGTTATFIEGVTYPESVTIPVSGVDPTLNAVELEQNEVTANGADAVTLSATATSAKGTDITNSVAWSVSPADKDVSIDADGKITVAAKAEAGNYTVTATPVDGKSQGVAKTATLTVSRDTAAAASISVSGDTETLDIPTDDAVTATFTATVKDQYGDVMTNPNVEWSISPAKEGVSITNGTVTVTANAKNEIADSQEFTVTAKAADNVTAEAKLTVRRSAAVAKTITVTATDDTTVTVPYTSSTIVKATFTAAVKDQYGADFTGDVVWSLVNAPAGISINSSGVVTVKPAAAAYVTVEGVSVSVMAVCGDARGIALLTVKRDTATATSIDINGSDTAVIPTAGSADNTYTYTAKVFDQYDLEMTDATVAMSLNSSDEKVTFADGTLTVKAGAAENTTGYTLTATCGNAQQTKTIKVVNKPDAVVTISGTPEGTVTYGDDAFKLTAEAAQKEATGTWSWRSSNPDVLTVDENGAVTIVGAGKATITAAYEDATYYGTDSVEIEVAQKLLGLKVSVKSKTYNGYPYTSLEFLDSDVLDGVLEGDIVTSKGTGISATFEDANAGEDKKVIVTGRFILEGRDGGNYTVPQLSDLNLTGTIYPKELTITGATAESRDYTPGDKTVTITEVTFNGVVDGETVAYTATGEMADENAGKQKDVTVTVTLKDSNYTLKNSGTTTKVDIEKINWTGTTLIETSGKYGSTVTVDVSSLPAATMVQNTKQYLITDEITGPNEYVLTLTNDASKVGEFAEYVSTFDGMVNYNSFTLTIRIKILDKDTQTITANNVNVVYGDTFTPVVNAQTAVTFRLKDDETLLRQNADGSLTAIGSGTTTVTAIAAETGDYKSASKEITVTIAQRKATVTADDVSIYVGEKLPELTYTVSGLVFGDSWITEPTLTTDPATVETNKAGEYEIIFSDLGSLEGAYDITYVSGKLSITAHTVVVPVSGKTVTVNPADNGSVDVSTGKASAGKTVTITITPDQGYELDELLVTDRQGNALTVTDLGNGRYSFVMPASSVTVSATFKQMKQSSYYADVLPGIWYYDAVQYVTEQGLMGGTGKGFEPDLTTSRAMIWTILARMDGVDTTAANGSWYVVAQSWAMANGVSDGTDPDGLITREQLAAMLYRYAVSKGIDVSVGEDTNILSYADATSVSEWAMSAMQWACGAGIINGVDGSLLPQGNATRAQTATMLMRYLELVK